MTKHFVAALVLIINETKPIFQNKKQRHYTNDDPTNDKQRRYQITVPS